MRCADTLLQDIYELLWSRGWYLRPDDQDALRPLLQRYLSDADSDVRSDIDELAIDTSAQAMRQVAAIDQLDAAVNHVVVGLAERHLQEALRTWRASVFLSSLFGVVFLMLTLIYVWFK